MSTEQFNMLQQMAKTKNNHILRMVILFRPQNIRIPNTALYYRGQSLKGKEHYFSAKARVGLWIIKHL